MLSVVGLWYEATIVVNLILMYPMLLAFGVWGRHGPIVMFMLLFLLVTCRLVSVVQYIGRCLNLFPSSKLI